MPTLVAVEGDIQFETSSAKHPSDTNSAGSWSLTDSSETLGTTLSVESKKVVIEASASWTYSGGTAGSPASPVGPFSDSATLTPGITVVKDNGSNIVLDGNEQAGSQDSGNKIVAVASHSLLKTD